MARKWNFGQPPGAGGQAFQISDLDFIISYHPTFRLYLNNIFRHKTKKLIVRQDTFVLQIRKYRHFSQSLADRKFDFMLIGEQIIETRSCEKNRTRRGGAEEIHSQQQPVSHHDNHPRLMCSY